MYPKPMLPGDTGSVTYLQPIAVKSNVTVKSNDFEKLLEKISAERETEKSSELNIQRRLEILKTISSVYFFMRCGLQMPYRAVSLEELEIAEARLKLIAEQEIKKFWNRFWNALGKKTFWHYYLQFGYFKDQCKQTAIGYWNVYNIWDYYSNNSDFEMALALKDKNAIPPNAKELMEEIFAKKYGAAKEAVK